MRPVLFAFEGFEVSSYGFFVAMGYVIGLAWTMTTMVRGGRAQKDVRDGAIVLVLGALLGGKVFHVLFEAQGHRLADGSLARGVVDLLVDDPLHAFGFAEPGFVLYGGIIGASLACVAFARSRGLKEIPRGFDDAAAPLALGIAIGRVGCHLAGCCHGVPVEGWFSVAFPEGHPTFPLHVFPTQLVEATFALALACALVVGRRRATVDGALFAAFCLAYGLFRLIIEGARGDATRGLFLDGWISTSQLVSVAMLALVAAWMARAARAPRPHLD